MALRSVSSLFLLPFFFFLFLFVVVVGVVAAGLVSSPSFLLPLPHLLLLLLLLLRLLRLLRLQTDPLRLRRGLSRTHHQRRRQRQLGGPQPRVPAAGRARGDRGAAAPHLDPERGPGQRRGQRPQRQGGPQPGDAGVLRRAGAPRGPGRGPQPRERGRAADGEADVKPRCAPGAQRHVSCGGAARPSCCRCRCCCSSPPRGGLGEERAPPRGDPHVEAVGEPDLGRRRRRRSRERRERSSVSGRGAHPAPTRAPAPAAPQQRQRPPRVPRHRGVHGPPEPRQPRRRADPVPQNPPRPRGPRHGGAQAQRGQARRDRLRDQGPRRAVVDRRAAEVRRRGRVDPAVPLEAAGRVAVAVDLPGAPPLGRQGGGEAGSGGGSGSAAGVGSAAVSVAAAAAAVGAVARRHGGARGVGGERGGAQPREARSLVRREPVPGRARGSRLWPGPRDLLVVVVGVVELVVLALGGGRRGRGRSGRWRGRGRGPLFLPMLPLLGDPAGGRSGRARVPLPPRPGLSRAPEDDGGVRIGRGRIGRGGAARGPAPLEPPGVLRLLQNRAADAADADAGGGDAVAGLGEPFAGEHQPPRAPPAEAPGAAYPARSRRGSRGRSRSRRRSREEERRRRRRRRSRDRGSGDDVGDDRGPGGGDGRLRRRSGAENRAAQHASDPCREERRAPSIAVRGLFSSFFSPSCCSRRGEIDEGGRSDDDGAAGRQGEELLRRGRRGSSECCWRAGLGRGRAARRRRGKRREQHLAATAPLEPERRHWQ